MPFYSVAQSSTDSSQPTSRLSSSVVMGGLLLTPCLHIGGERRKKRALAADPSTPRGKKRATPIGPGTPTSKTAARANPNGYVCTQCGTQTTPVWRAGPKGPKTLCNGTPDSLPPGPPAACAAASSFVMSFTIVSSLLHYVFI